MKKYIKNILLFLLPLCSLFTYAQQDPQFTFYTYNTISVNPGYAGSRGHLSIVGLNRSQWVGLDGAPTTQTLGIDSPIGKNLGAGLVLINDRLGPSNEFYVDGNISYTLKLDELGKRLSFGVKGGGRVLNVDFSKGTFQNPDAVFQENINSRFFPTIGAGLYYHTNKSYLGAAVPNFLAQEQYSDVQESVAVERLHFFFIGGTVFDLSYNWKLKPSFFVQLVSGAPAIADVSASVLYNEKFSLGASYRWDDSFSGLVGIQISPSINIGYAYDFTTTNLRNFNSGTHEIFLRFEFKSLEQKIKSPRFF
ncbi:type IX secretion system membrane protein PorP/SprF [Flavobacteriaceae bacterium R38]|nr:type IX secretion system membrane protein PorP/SprF [Flavobacteriaceae bacterium R38]